MLIRWVVLVLGSGGLLGNLKVEKVFSHFEVLVKLTLFHLEDFLVGKDNLVKSLVEAL